jgi:putative ABC transport system permease protein
VFLAIRDLRRAWRRFILVGLVVALVSLLSTVLTGLADGLVTDGISGLRSLSATHLVFSEGSQAAFSRSTLHDRDMAAWTGIEGVEASPLGVSFVNGAGTEGRPNIDLALFGVPPDSFLVERPEAHEALAGRPGLVLSTELRDEGVEVGDVYDLGGSGVRLPVLGFTFAGTYGHVPIAFVSLDQWRQVSYGTDARGRFSAVAVRAESGVDVAAIAGPDLEVKTKVQAYDGSPGYTAETATMTLIRAFLIVISALIVGAFFTVLTVQRTRQIGLLKALGASSAYILRDGIGQIAVVVVVATAAGAALGAAITAVLEGGAVPVELDPRNVGITAVLLVATGIAGSLAALRRITKVEPVIALGVEG